MPESSDLSPHDLTMRVPSSSEGAVRIVRPQVQLVDPQKARAATQARSQAAAPALDPMALLFGLSRRWVLALFLGSLVGAAAATAAWYLVPAPYTAFALLRMSSVVPRVVLQTAEAQSDFHTYRDTQIALAKSHFVLNAALRKPDVAALPVVQQTPHPLLWLEKSIRVYTSGSAEILKVEMSGDDPQAIATLVNAVRDAYLEEVVNAERNLRFARLNDLERIHNETEEKVRTKRGRVKKLAETLGSGDSEALTVKQQGAMEFFSQLRREHTQLRFELMREELQLKASEGEAGPGESIKPTDPMIDLYLAQDPDVQKREFRINQLQDLISRYEDQIVSKNHPTLTAYRNELEAAQKSVIALKEKLRPMVAERVRSNLNAQSAATVDERKTRVALLKKQEEVLRKEVETHSAEAIKIGTSSFELEDMKADIQQIDEVADRISHEVTTLQIELQAPSRVTPIQPAEPPQLRDTKRKYLMTGAAGFGGFAAMCVLIGFFEVRARRICNVDDVTNGLQIRIMGALPAMPKWVRNGSRKADAARVEFWHNVLTESIDAARTLLIRDASLDSTRLVMVSSAVSGEGKTTLSCHLASSMARAGRNTLLVDCDLRRPSAHKVFDVPLEPGFCELITGRATLEEVIRATGEGGPWMIPAGKFTSKALEKLAQEGLAAIFEELRQRFDFVIVDTSPVLPVNDAILVSQHIDAVILSIRRSVSRLAKVSAVLDRFGMLGVPVIGAVAIGLDSEAHGYGFRYGDGYGYGYGYGYSYGEARKLKSKQAT